MTPRLSVEFKEAKEAGITTRPVLVGPVSFLHLGKADRGQSVDPITCSTSSCPSTRALKKLKEAGAETVQIDEPVLVFDLPSKDKAAFKPAYEKLRSAKVDSDPQAWSSPPTSATLSTTSTLSPALNALRSPRRPRPQPRAARHRHWRSWLQAILSCGVVDGRNIWKTNMQKRAIETVETAIQKLGKDRVIVATSSSLLHTPHTLASEKKLDDGGRDWFSFASRRPSRSPSLPRLSLMAPLPSK